MVRTTYRDLSRYPMRNEIVLNRNKFSKEGDNKEFNVTRKLIGKMRVGSADYSAFPFRTVQALTHCGLCVM